MPDRFVEYQSVRTATPLRQGDVLESVGEPSSPWLRHLLVITADCDLAYAKHQGRVTCVPLLDADDYLLGMQIPKLRDTVGARAVSSFVDLVRTSTGRRLTHARVREWALQAAPLHIVTELQMSDEHRDRANNILESIRAAGREDRDLDEAISSLVEAQSLLEPATARAKIADRMVERLKQSFVQPPGDAVFLSAIAESCTTGYFAYLRHIEQVMEPVIALASTRTSVSYRRIARLEDRYTHAIVQRFAMVFLSIGLPTDYEEMRQLHADSLTERIA